MPSPLNPALNPAQIVVGRFLDVMRKEFSVEGYLHAAAAREVAWEATQKSVDQIVTFLKTNADGLERDALLLVVGIERHASTLDDIGQEDLALSLYAAIQPVFERYAQPEQLAVCCDHRGIVLFRLGRFAEAKKEYDRAIAILRYLVEEVGRTEYANELTHPLMNKATLLAELGRASEAVDEYEKVIALRRRLVEGEGRTELANDLAAAFMNKAIALTDLGRLSEAVGEYERAIAIRRRLVEEEGRAELANDLAVALLGKASVLGMLGQLGAAIEGCERAVVVLRNLVEVEGRSELANDFALALMNKASTLSDLGQFREAVGEYERAITILRRLVEEEGREELANNLASALMQKTNALGDLGQLGEAVADFDRVIAIFRRMIEEKGHIGLGNDLAIALLNKGLVLELQGEMERALAVYRSIDVSSFRCDELRKYHSAVSDILWQQGHRDEALEHLNRAVNAYRQARVTARLDETFLEYMAERSGFIDTAVCRAVEAGREREAFSCAQDGKAGVFSELRSRLQLTPGEAQEEVRGARRNLVTWLRRGPGSASHLEAWLTEHTRRTQEYLRLWRIASAVRGAAPVPLPEQDVQPASLDEIQVALAPGWAILDFWRTANEEVTAFVVTRDSFSVQKLSFPVASQGFHDNLTALLDLMQNPLICMQDETTNDTALDDLHAYLFAPLRPLLREKAITGLYLVPQGFLHALPLHAVRRKVKGEVRHLCDDFTVAYLPSAALLPRLPELRAAGSLLSLANPDRGNPNSLPFSDWEGWRLSGRAGGAVRSHRGRQATFEATDDWDQFATLHFSCHGAGDIQFAPLSRLYLHDDLVLAHDVTYRRPPLRQGALVILNGCQTGVKDQRATDESMGLMSAFLMRGAGLVLSTMWSVVDACAAEMVLSFVEELLDRGKPPVEALREAQKRARAMTWEEYQRRSAEVEQLFDPVQHPHELSKLLTQKAWVSSRCGLADEARASAERAAPLLRQAGMEVEAERILALTRSLDRLPRPTGLPLPFDHPILWGAFQLVGRVR